MITGSRGFVGTHLARRLEAQGHKVLGFDYLIDPALDLRSSVSDGPLHWMMSQADAVFHLAGTASRTFCENRPAEALGDVVIATRVLQTCLEYKIPCIVASSAWVYSDYAAGKPHDRLFCEKDETRIPENTTWYGVVKLMIEQMIQKYRCMGLKVTATRFFNIYGPEQEKAITYPSTVVTWLIQRSLDDGKVPPLSSPSGPTRDFVYIDDVVDGMVTLMKKAQRGEDLHIAYNLGSGHSTSISALARIVAATLRLPLPLHSPVETSTGGACLCRIGEEGWEPRVSLEHGIQQTVDAIQRGRYEITPEGIV